MVPVPIETERLRLDPWAPEHTALLVQLSSLPPVTRHLGLGTVWASELAEQVAAAQREHWARHGFGWRATVDKQDGRAIGLAALAFAGEGTAGLDATDFELGWWLHPGAWGRGLAAESARAMRDEAFEVLGAPSVIARIQHANTASLRVAAAIGMTFERETTGRFGEALGIHRLSARPPQS